VSARQVLLAAALLTAAPAVATGCGDDDGGCPTTDYDYGQDEFGQDTPEEVLEAEAIASLRLPDDVEAYRVEADGDGTSEGDEVTYSYADDEVDATLVVRRGRSAWVLDSTRICVPET
jgi:hypothetical protein